MVTPKRMEETSAESRRRILDAAEQLFAENGFVETSLAEVATRSGISRGSIPWHFDNKLGLLMAVVDRAAQQANAAPIPPGIDGLEEAISEIGDRLREPHMALLHTLLGEASKPDSVIRDAYATHHKRDRSAVRSWIDTSPDIDVASVDAQDLSALIYAMVIGINVQWRINPEEIDLDKTLAAMGSLLATATSQRAASR